MVETIAKLVKYSPPISVQENGGVIHDYFERNADAEGVVLVDGYKPAGIVMRNDFYQKIGRQYGFTIYMRRNIALIMKTDITCVEFSCDMAKLGIIAMNRSKDSLYDHIVVLEEDKYIGIVSISEFLLEMSRTKEREIELLNLQQSILRQANEAEKQHRLEIEHKNASVKNLLDNTGQGFLSFGEDLLVSEEYSRECNEIFGCPVGHQPFLELLSGFLEESVLAMMWQAFEKVFTGPDKNRNRIYLSLLPKELTIRERVIRMEYKVLDNLSAKSVMIILTDITEKKALEQKNAEEKNRVKLIIKALNCRADITGAMEQLREFMGQGLPLLMCSSVDKKELLLSVYRLFHTMKGDFSLNGMYNTARELHKLEDVLGEMLKNPDALCLEQLGEMMRGIDCEVLWKKDKAILEESLGKQYFEKEEALTATRKRLEEVQKEFCGQFDGEYRTKALQLVDSIFYINLKDSLKNFSEYLTVTAQKLGKELTGLEIAGPDVYVDKSTLGPFIQSLVHIFRNIADHGIEEPDERMEAGKPEQGRVSCSLSRQEERFALRIRDDGRGIDAAVIARKAVDKEICTETEIQLLTEQQILNLIFCSSFSTKDAVDMLSGRGMGLSAVWEAVTQTGGTVRVETKPGLYTEFIFDMPLQPSGSFSGNQLRFL